MLSLSVAGCLGGEDEKPPSKVHLVWGAETTAGTVYHTYAPNSQNQTQDLVSAEFTFDFNETYSEEGDIDKFWVDPGNGGQVVEVSASDMSTVTISYDQHGIYRAVLGANDTNGNSDTVEVLLRVEYHISYDNQNEGDPYPIWFDCAPGSQEASPSRVDLLSNVTNPTSPLPFSGGPSTVTWVVRDPSDAEIESSTKEIQDGASDQFGWGENDPLAGGWRLDIDVDGDNVNTETNIEITYEALETPVPEPPVQQG